MATPGEEPQNEDVPQNALALGVFVGWTEYCGAMNSWLCGLPRNDRMHSLGGRER